MTQTNKIRGVNLGGWLVLERWMTPSLFAGLDAKDETDFCVELGERAQSALRAHWETFITVDDFKWIAATGLNSVRIPIGHWIFGDTAPYHGAIDVLDWAIQTAAEHGLSVLLDFHAAPGCQNGFDNGGIAGVMDWHRYPANIDQSVTFIGRIAERYRSASNLLGIQLLNEPHWDVPLKPIQDYYLRAHAKVREFLSAEQAVVVFHDGFRPLAWSDFMEGDEKAGVIQDTHIYQCFTPDDHATTADGHIRKAAERGQLIREIEQHFPAIVGEWSLGLSDESFKGLTDFQIDNARRAYGATQLLNYDAGAGWYFWSYRLEDGVMPSWNFRTCVERGWLPSRFEQEDA